MLNLKATDPMHINYMVIFLGLVASATLAPAQTVNVWLTTDTQSQKLQPQSSVVFTSGNSGSNPVPVDETQTYQEIEGFGASFTDSAAYLLNQVATPIARTNAMNNLFTRNGSGIGVSFVRNPMGASDLARFHYSYNDNPPGGTDPSLTHFNIAHDQADIIPLVQQALALNPQLKIMASPWSPPGWMKDSGAMIGGTLLPGMYEPFARYFVKYIQAYQAVGIPIHYISLQNEPLYVPGNYPGMGMDAATQRTLLRDYVLPALLASNLTTKVLVYDHNWDVPEYPDTVLSDPTLQASEQIAGVAWHGYGGTPGVILTTLNKYPNKGNFQTEHSGGTWVGNQVRSDFRDIIHVMRSGGKAYVKWSLVLDQNRGPNAGGCDTCTPLVTVNTTSGAVSYNIDFYTLGHFSKFVLPGARRIYSGNASGVISAAFLNPDGSKALVAFNDTTSSKTFQVHWGGKSFSYTLASYAGATFTWTGTQTSGYTVNPANQIQGASFNASFGLVTESTSDPGGGFNLGYADNNDFAVYRNVDFGAGYSNVTARVASFGGGTVEFRLNSPNGPRIAALTMPNTGGWQTFQNVSGAVSNVSGLQQLHLVFKGGGSVGNLNWFQFGGARPGGPPGPATQLIWTTQPGLATNGWPFAQQPVLQTADQSGVPSTNALPDSLNVVITPSAGTGPLLGITNFNLGTSGGNGFFAFTDLQINSVGAGQTLTASVPSTTTNVSNNLLFNGNFDLPDSGAPAEGWTPWVTGNAWANHENNPAISLNGTYYLVNGGFENTSAGQYQVVPAAAGLSYTLSVQSGADAWWLPYGEMRLIFLDASTNELALAARPTVDPAVYGQNYDIPHPWANYTLTAIAPAATTQVKVEFVSTGSGSVWFDNASLIASESLPPLASATTQPFTVHASVSPPSQTNYVAGITPQNGGSYMLQFVGTPGVQYFVQTTTNLAPPIVWAAVSGSTHTVTNANGLWELTVSNHSAQQFFRAAVAAP
jgi:glucosylceramidase